MLMQTDDLGNNHFYASVSREAAVVYQMGSYYSLWVTDPYDLEIGSTKATRFSCPRSKAK